MPQKLEAALFEINDFISFLSQLRWHAYEVASFNEAFVKAMVNALWEIDGHHDVFKARNMPNPSTLDPFTVYYIPELSKHCKRSRQNLSFT